MALEQTYSNGSGSQFTINLCGATVTSWKIGEEEILFCSKKAIRDGSKAIRGGIPLVFPNFGPWELGPQHGFARNKQWKLDTDSVKDQDENPSWTFILEDDEGTRNMWNKRFRLEYTVQLFIDTLKTSLYVNNTGEDSFSFTTLLHTYFRVDNIKDTRIKGLQNLKYVDKVNGGEHKEERELVCIDENYDRIYKDRVDNVTLYPDNNQSSITREISTNLPDIVVWNPWIEKAKGMSDFDDNEYLNMICVEVGAVSKPLTLAPGNKMVASQTIKVGQKSKI
ncbi:hypothetical protein ACF0H5_013368 [Mactra antiquata]